MSRHMKTIIINGPLDVGKTTIEKHIADHYSGTAFINGDWHMDTAEYLNSKPDSRKILGGQMT